MKSMNSTAIRLALGVAFTLLIAQFFFRPLWRDEFWALYFSAPNDAIWQTITTKISRDVHPPLYFSLLHFWRQISENEIFARFLNLVFIGAAGWSIWRLRGAREEATKLFLFLCATSFWLVFYSAEIRMMGGLFCASAVLAIIARHAIDAPDKTLTWALAYAGVGAIAASSHFFGSLWVACLGAAIGTMHLLRGRMSGFLMFGVASLIAILPALIWIAFARPDQNPGAPQTQPPFLESLEFSSNQFLRGIIIKTVFANVLAFIAGAMGAFALFKREGDDSVKTLGLGIALTVIISFGVHLGVVALIKERAFIVIIPALLYILAEGILALKPHQSRALKMARWIPIAAAVSLPLFTSEFFKDRERVADLKELMTDSPDCAGQPIIAYLRPSDQAADFSGFMTKALLKNAIEGGFEMVPLNDIIAGKTPLPETSCRIKVIAIALLRGERDEHQLIRDDIARAGIDLGALEELRMGGGRTRAWVTPTNAPKE